MRARSLHIMYISFVCGAQWFLFHWVRDPQNIKRHRFYERTTNHKWTTYLLCVYVFKCKHCFVHTEKLSWICENWKLYEVAITTTKTNIYHYYCRYTNVYVYTKMASNFKLGKTISNVLRFGFTYTYERNYTVFNVWLFLNAQVNHRKHQGNNHCEWRFFDDTNN